MLYYAVTILKFLSFKSFKVDQSNLEDIFFYHVWRHCFKDHKGVHRYDICQKQREREDLILSEETISKQVFFFFLCQAGFIWQAVRYNAPLSILIWSTLRYVTSLWGLTLSSAALQPIGRDGPEYNAPLPKKKKKDWYLVRHREIGGDIICFPDLMAHLTLKASNQSWPEVGFTTRPG